MAIQLTDEMLSALSAHPDQSLIIEDQRTRTRYVLMREEAFGRRNEMSADIFEEGLDQSDLDYTSPGLRETKPIRVRIEPAGVLIPMPIEYSDE